MNVNSKPYSIAATIVIAIVVLILLVVAGVYAYVAKVVLPQAAPITSSQIPFSAAEWRAGARITHGRMLEGFTKAAPNLLSGKSLEEVEHILGEPNVVVNQTAIGYDFASNDLLDDNLVLIHFHNGYFSSISLEYGGGVPYGGRVNTGLHKSLP